MRGIGKSLALLAAVFMVGGGLTILPSTDASAQITIPLPFIGGPSIRFDPNYRRGSSGSGHRAAKSHTDDSSSSDKTKEKDARDEEVNGGGSGGGNSGTHQSPTGPAHDVSHSVETDAPSKGGGSGSGKTYDDQPSFAPSR
jgi:hypothetical protein